MPITRNYNSFIMRDRHMLPYDKLMIDHVGPFNLGNPGEFTMLELAEVGILFINAFMDHRLPTTHD